MHRFLLALAALSAGCARDDRAVPAPVAVSDSVLAPAPRAEVGPPVPSVGPSATDTLIVEGMSDAVEVRHVREAAFPLPFEARVPAPMAYETVSSGEGDAARFTLGEPPEGSLFTVVVLPETATEASARSFARDVAGTQGTVSEASGAPGWAIVAFDTRRDVRAGAVWLGRHAGRYFYVLTDVAGEAFEGFGPRAAYILRHWRWLDDGSALGE